MGQETTITFRLGTIMVLSSLVVGIISSVSTYAFTYGVNTTEREAQVKVDEVQQKNIDGIHIDLRELRKELKQYTDIEVGGLRADWERELKRRK